VTTAAVSTITDLGALELAAALQRRELSGREVMAAFLDRIDRLNPAANALVNLAPAERLLDQAAAADAVPAAQRRWMHGLPQAIKDTGHAAGFPTTYGCVLLKDAVAPIDSLMTARMKATGSLVIAKTNMPEFGLGSHTFNELFGATPNAWDPAVSAGGSSGGAGAALALRLLPVADGSDFMGSLRNPAAWANIFGLRPSQGRVPFWPSADAWVAQLGTEGPMARSVADLAALLATQSGPDPRSPLALTAPLVAGSVAPGEFRGAYTPALGAALAHADDAPVRSLLAHLPAPGDTTPLRGLTVAWLGDLNGHLATEGGILAGCEAALARMSAAGAEVEAVVAPGFEPEGVWRAWLAWRRALVGPRVAPLLAKPGARGIIKPEAQWEHDQAAGLGALDFMQASEARTRFHQQMLALLERHDVIALPVTQVWPFPLEQRWPQAIAGRAMDTYHRWMEVTLYATFAGLPGISLPAGFHANGRWPLGLQLIGRPQGDADLLRVAAAYESLIGDWLARRPETA
jgi:amidase